VSGRTFAESARVVLAASVESGGLPTTIDETTFDLVAHDAARRFTAALTHGVSLVDGAAGWLAELTRTNRIVARADSARRDVSRVLELSSLENLLLFVRCGDDAPRLPQRSSLDSSWAAIDARLTSIGVPTAQRLGFEHSELAADAARPFVASVQRPTFRHALTSDSTERG
jgi:hypothetical protein